MPQADKRAYTAKQIRKARDIEQSYEEERGVSEKESERRAWSTVNKQNGGGLEARTRARAVPSKGASANGVSLGSGANRSATATRRSPGKPAHPSAGPGRSARNEDARQRVTRRKQA